MLVLMKGRDSKAENTRFRDELQAIDRKSEERRASAHISNYFSDLHVPDHIDLCSARYVNMCVDTTICDAVDAAYGAMKANGRLQSSCGDGTMSEDIRFVIRLLKGIRAKCVPQEFSAGILLMHLEIVEDIKF